MGQESSEEFSAQVGVASGRLSREDHGRSICPFVRECQRVSLSEIPAVLCKHVLAVLRATVAAVFVAQ